MWNICFGLSIFFFACGITMFFWQRREGHREILWLAGGVFAAAVYICYPVMQLQEANYLFATFMSFSHAIRMFVVDTGINDIVGKLPVESLGSLYHAYKLVVCALYLIAPLFTLGVVLRYFSNIFERLRLWNKKNQDLYIFSELNDRSVAIAENVWKKYNKDDRHVGIVFCKSDDRDDSNKEMEMEVRRFHSVFTPKTMEQLCFSGNGRKLVYFAISKKEEENLDMTLRMIDRLAPTGQDKTYIYCYSMDNEAEILIDSKQKENLRVILVDETREAVYDLLFHHPLYANQNPQEWKEGRGRISILIAGGGKTGTEFLKAAVWCGQMEDMDMEIHLLDRNGASIEKSLALRCPELFDDGKGGKPYPIHMYEEDVFSLNTKKILDQINSISYCVISLGDDEVNIRAAIFLRRYFAQRAGSIRPIVAAYISNPKKQDTVWGMYEKARGWHEGYEGHGLYPEITISTSQNKVYYDIIPFGDMHSMFGAQTNSAFLLEYLAMGVHLYYWRTTSNTSEEERVRRVREFYDRQYNRRSSMTSGLHMKYKLWELGYGILRIPEDKKQLQIFKECIRETDFYHETKEKRKNMYAVEHNRWMAFMRSEGWKLTADGRRTLDAVKETYRSYYARFKNQNMILKLHPALVPIRENAPEGYEGAYLDEVSSLVAEMNADGAEHFGAYRNDYIESNQKLIENISFIISGKWCGTKGLLIRESRIRESQCVICRLSDMGEYYLRLYQDIENQAHSERILVLREHIKSCAYGVLRNKDASAEERAEAFRNLGRMAKAQMEPELAMRYEKLAEEER